MARTQILRGMSVQLLDLYGVYKPQPKIGSHIMLPLAIGEKGKRVDAVPSLRNLAWHFGFFQDVNELFRNCVLKGVDFDSEHVKGLEWYKVEVVFERQHVMPVRRWLDASEEHPFLFYCIPKGEIFRKDETTGLLRFGYQREMPLTLLPKSAKEAKERYGISDDELHLLAMQVAWLILRLARIRSFHKRSEAWAALADWRSYLFGEMATLLGGELTKLLPP